MAQFDQLPKSIGNDNNVVFALAQKWDIATLAWVKDTGGGGGGAVTVADGADVAQGTTSDAAWVAGNGTVISLLKKIASAGGSAVSIADGADVVEGFLADAAVVTDAAGTVSGKLRGLIKWAFERMPTSLGQKAMAASLPVVVASDQSAIPVSGPLTDAQLRATPVPISGAVTNTVLSVVGGGLEATAQRVTLASDSTGLLSVDDNGASLTVDAPVGTPVFVRLSDGAAPIATLPISAAALPLPAGAATLAAQTQPGVDIGDVTINNGAAAAAVNVQDGGNSLTVDAPVGTPVFTRLSDGAAALVGQKAMAASLPVVIASDQSAVPISGAVTNTVLSVVGGGAEATAQRVTIANDSTGVLSVDDNGASLTVDAPVGTPVNVQIGNATLSAGVIDETGASAVDALAVGGGTAHDAVDSGNPIKIGGIARQANPTAVAALDRVAATFDDVGRQVCVVGQVRDLMVHQHTQIASSAAETTILAAAAAIFHDLTQLVITNETATAVTVTIKDATAGTTRMIIALAASGGAVIPFQRPLTQSAVNGNWTATLSSAAVTVNFLVQAEKNV